jgi:hypothetical protein
MKKFSIGILTLALITTLSVVPMKAEELKAPIAPTEKVNDEEIARLMSRLEEMKALDKKTMTSSEKKEMRKEIKSIEAELKQLNGGVYISVGAIIIILLLLIILL